MCEGRRREHGNRVNTGDGKKEEVRCEEGISECVREGRGRMKTEVNKTRVNAEDRKRRKMDEEGDTMTATYITSAFHYSLPLT